MTEFERQCSYKHFMRNMRIMIDLQWFIQHLEENWFLDNDWELLQEHKKTLKEYACISDYDEKQWSKQSTP